ELFSTQKIDNESYEICKSMPTEGEEQIARSLLTEAVKREMFIQLQLLSQKDPKLIQNLNNSEEDKKDNFVLLMQENVINHFYNAVLPIVKDMLPEIINKFK